MLSLSSMLPATWLRGGIRLFTSTIELRRSRAGASLDRVLCLMLLAAAPCFPTVIENAATPGFVTGTSAFTGVVGINLTQNGQATFCTGSLLTGGWVLTAGHCIDGASGWQVVVQSSSGTTFLPVTEALLHPLFGPRPAPSSGGLQYDIGLLQLGSAAPADAQIYTLKTDFVGLTTSTLLDMVGYGLFGDASAGITGKAVRHHVENSIDGYYTSISDGPNTIPTPDLPIFREMSFTLLGDPNPTPDFLGLPAAGDSGSPILFGNMILGVADTSTLPRNIGDTLSFQEAARAVRSTALRGRIWLTPRLVIGSWLQSSRSLESRGCSRRPC